MQAEERALKRHLYARLYDSEALKPIRIEAQRIVGDLASFYRESRAVAPGLAARRGRRPRGCAASATSSPE